MRKPDLIQAKLPTNQITIRNIESCNACAFVVLRSVSHASGKKNKSHFSLRDLFDTTDCSITVAEHRRSLYNKIGFLISDFSSISSLCMKFDEWIRSWTWVWNITVITYWTGRTSIKLLCSRKVNSKAVIVINRPHEPVGQLTRSTSIICSASNCEIRFLYGR